MIEMGFNVDLVVNKSDEDDEDILYITDCKKCEKLVNFSFNIGFSTKVYNVERTIIKADFSDPFVE